MFNPCLCRSVRGRLGWNCTSNYNIPLKQIPDWITDCDRHVCVNWTETKGPLSTINIKLGLVVLQKSNNQYLSILCARPPPPHANMTQNKRCLGAGMPTVAPCVHNLWPMTCIYTVSACGGFSHSRNVRQGAACETFGQETLEVCGPLDGKQKQLHLNFLSSRSHHFGELHPSNRSKKNRWICFCVGLCLHI